MDLTIDIGNTSLTALLMKGTRVQKRLRIPTKEMRNLGALKREFMRKLGAQIRVVERVAIVSVVPKLTRMLLHIVRERFEVKPFVATISSIPMKLTRYDRKQLGADRLLAAFAAYHRFQRPVIVIDAGTAITIDLVNARGAFAGGVIVPGLNTAAASLHAMTAKLPRIKPAPVKRVLARATREAINAGVVVGTAGLVDRLVEEMSAEAHVDPLVIATGGDAVLLSSESRTIRRLEPDLLHQGLRWLLA